MSAIGRRVPARRPGAPVLPVGPVLELAGGVAGLALRTGAGRRQVERWRHSGVTIDQADVIAVLCGYHPAEVWPEWLGLGIVVDHGVGDVDGGGCGWCRAHLEQPERGRPRRWCSARCRRAAGRHRRSAM